MLNLLPVKRSRFLPDTIDRVFDDPFFRFFENGPTQSWTPAVEVEEKEDSIVFTFEVPGINQEDISINVENGLLTFSGEKRGAREEGSSVTSERWYGRFSRSFRLPNSADTQNIDAQLKNGILTVSVPKREEARSRKVKVKVV